MAQKTTMERDVRKLSMNIDHGGPFLIYDDDPNDKIQKGMIIDTLFCNDPECSFVHIRAILVDEQMKNVRSEGAQLLSIHFDSRTKNKDLPNQSLQASFDVETDELLIQEDIDVQSDNKELLYLLEKQISKGLSDVFKRRWRAEKQKNSEAWKEKDWSWWQPGELVSWNEVFSDDFSFMVTLYEKSYFGLDHYCITPGCTCNDVAIIFLGTEENNELGSVFTDTIKLKVKDVHLNKASEQDLLKCWDQLNIVYPDLKKRLQQRYKEMKRVGAEIAKISGNFKAPVVTGTKMKRNDPCPCGSGKKYKKCCMDK